MERTLFFLKPDAVVRKCVGAKVLEEVVGLGCVPKVFASVRPSKDFVGDQHYYMHKGKPFYDWLLDFVTCENVILCVLEGEEIISRIRGILGSATVEKAVLESPSSLRARYGLFRGVNLAHASDSYTSASHEIERWTANFNLTDDIHASKNIEKYLSDNLNCKYVETSRYRHLAEDLEKQVAGIDVKKKFVQLLREENGTFETTRLEHFAEVALAAI